MEPRTKKPKIQSVSPPAAQQPFVLSNDQQNLGMLLPLDTKADEESWRRQFLRDFPLRYKPATEAHAQGKSWKILYHSAGKKDYALLSEREKELVCLLKVHDLAQIKAKKFTLETFLGGSLDNKHFYWLSDANDQDVMDWATDEILDYILSLAKKYYGRAQLEERQKLTWITVCLGRGLIEADVKEFAKQIDNPMPGSLALLAARYGRMNVLQLLQDQLSGECDSDGRTVVHYAALGGHGRIIEELHRRGLISQQKHDAPDAFGITPWRYAKLKGHVECATFLENYFSTRKKAFPELRRLEHAARRNCVTALRFLLARAEEEAKDDDYEEPEVKQKGLNTALIFTSKLTIADRLLKVGAQWRPANLPESQQSYYPIFNSVCNWDGEQAVAYLSEHSSVDEINYAGPDVRGAIFAAVTRDHYSTCERLLALPQCNINLSISDVEQSRDDARHKNNRLMPGQVVIRGMNASLDLDLERISLIESFLKHPQFRPYEVQTNILLDAARVESEYGPQLMRKLCALPNVNINVQDIDGWTALQVATRLGISHKMVHTILEQKEVNVCTRNAKGETALDIALTGIQNFSELARTHNLQGKKLEVVQYNLPRIALLLLKATYAEEISNYKKSLPTWVSCSADTNAEMAAGDLLECLLKPEMTTAEELAELGRRYKELSEALHLKDIYQKCLAAIHSIQPILLREMARRKAREELLMHSIATGSCISKVKEHHAALCFPVPDYRYVDRVPQCAYHFSDFFSLDQLWLKTDRGRDVIQLANNNQAVLDFIYQLANLSMRRTHKMGLLLYVAACTNQKEEEIVDLLLAPDLNESKKLIGQSAMQGALKYGHLEFVSMLRHRGVDLLADQEQVPEASAAARLG